MENKNFTFSRDINVYSVPDGTLTLLKQNQQGIIVQSLGDNFTIIVEGNMFQVKGKDADAIGEEIIEIDSNNFASEDEIWNVLHTCYDPEIPVNIVDLGLIYDCSINSKEDGVDIHIKMTLTAPGCGMGPVIAGEVKQKLEALSGARNVMVELVWEPQWNQEMMSDAAKLQLGLY